MSDLKHIEKTKIETLFEMRGGFILDFTNRSFESLIVEAVNISVYSEEYNKLGESKANRLRTIWIQETNYRVGKILDSLLEYYREIFMQSRSWNSELDELFKEVQQIAHRLKSGLTEHIENIQPNSDEKDFDKLSTNIRELIETDKPEQALDRLHTFVTKFLRNYLQTHGIAADPEKPLHSLLGEYIKAIKAKNYLQTEMSEKILKSSISILDAFNHVRNNQSLAHANALLNHEESLYIFRSISSMIEFINTIEKNNRMPAERTVES